MIHNNDLALNQGRPDVASQIFAADYVDPVTGQPDNIGPEGQKQFIDAI